MNIKIRFLVEKSGNYYWQPSTPLRAQGYRPMSLGRDWDVAQAEARRLNDELDQERYETPQQRTSRSIRNPQATLNDFWLAFQSTRAFRELSFSTRRDYMYHYQRKIAPVMGDLSPRRIRRADVQLWYSHMRELAENAGKTTNGPNKSVATLRRLLSYVLDQGHIDINVAMNQRLKGVAPRTVRWTDDEVNHLIATADRMGLPAIGDAVLLAVYTALRQGDILGLKWVEYQDGRLYRRQNKTGAMINIPAVPRLQARLEQARCRAEQLPATIIRHENTSRAYGADNFRHRFALVRAKAGKAMPAVLQKTFGDLRDTAITKLAEAGCTAIEISAISGHSINSVNTILRHYVVTGARLADGAITKLMESEGR